MYDPPARRSQVCPRGLPLLVRLHRTVGRSGLEAGEVGGDGRLEERIQRPAAVPQPARHHERERDGHVGQREPAGAQELAAVGERGGEEFEPCDEPTGVTVSLEPQLSAHSTQHTAHSTQHTAHSTPHTAHRTQHTAHSTAHRQSARNAEHLTMHHEVWPGGCCAGGRQQRGECSEHDVEAIAPRRRRPRVLAACTAAPLFAGT